MAAWIKTRQRVVSQIRYSLADFTIWTPADVSNWITQISEGSIVLTSFQTHVKDALAEKSGHDLNTCTETDLQDWGLRYSCREQLLLAIQDLKDNEAQNLERRQRAHLLSQAFLNADADGSGTLDHSEISAVVLETFPDTSRPLLTVHYNSLLNNKDLTIGGEIQLGALRDNKNTAMMSLMKEVEQAEKIEAAFKELDADGSGELDIDEMRLLVDRCFPNTGPTVRRRQFKAIVDEVDQNKDGTITLEEFLGAQCTLALLAPPAPTARSTRRIEGGPQSPRRQEPLESAFILKPSAAVVPFEVHGDHTGVSGEVLQDKAEEILDRHQDWAVAEELFRSAAAAFESQEEWRKAAACCQRLADCQECLGRWTEAADSVLRAADCFKEVGNLEEAVACLLEVADSYKKHNRTRKVAFIYKEISQLYAQHQMLEETVDWLRDSVDLLDKSTEWLEVRRCLQVILEYYVALQLWSEGKDICDEIVTSVKGLQATDPQLPLGPEADIGTYTVHGLFCALADLATRNPVRRMLQLENVGRTFEQIPLPTHSSAEFTLLKKMLAAFRAPSTGDEGLLSDALTFYCTGRDVPLWRVALFRGIQSNLKEAKSYVAEVVESRYGF